MAKEKAKEDYKREDYTEIIAQVSNTVVRDWLNGEGDNSWETIRDNLWDVTGDDMPENEFEAIFEWVEAEVDEAQTKAKNAIDS